MSEEASSSSIEHAIEEMVLTEAPHRVSNQPSATNVSKGDATTALVAIHANSGESTASATVHAALTATQVPDTTSPPSSLQEVRPTAQAQQAAAQHSPSIAGPTIAVPGTNQESSPFAAAALPEPVAKTPVASHSPPLPPQNKPLRAELLLPMSVSTTPAHAPTPPDAAGTAADASIDAYHPASSEETPRKKKARRTTQPPTGQSTGRWTEDEHQAFLQGLHTYGREWKKVASHIPTRSSAQVRSHAQKYFAKLQKEEDVWATSTTTTTMEGWANAVVVPGEVGATGSSSTLSSGVQANVARIIAHPERVEAEVEDTLRQLRQRYEALQRRLEQTSASPTTTTTASQPPNKNHRKRRQPSNPPVVHDDHSSVTSLSASTLQDEELIAVSVLRGALPNGSDVESRESSLSSAKAVAPS